jgi:hypothetical protein
MKIRKLVKTLRRRKRMTENFSSELVNECAKDLCFYSEKCECKCTERNCETSWLAENLLRAGWVKPPAYIGMKVWVPYVWVFKEIMTDLREGHVSGLQQKADRSWKIRVTRNGSVADYTVEEFNKYCFLNKEDAERYIEEKVKEHSSDS